jgi:hypothetical protein
MSGKKEEKLICKVTKSIEWTKPPQITDNLSSTLKDAKNSFNFFKQKFEQINTDLTPSKIQPQNLKGQPTNIKYKSEAGVEKKENQGYSSKANERYTTINNHELESHTISHK